MRIGQSAYTPVHILICLALHVVSLLISLEHAMSGDDLVVGLPATESSSDDSFAMGKAAVRRRGARPEIGRDRDSDESSESWLVGGGAAETRVHRPRARREVQVSGALWAIATAGDAGVAKGTGPQEAFALVRLSWALVDPDYNARNKYDVGFLKYKVDKCFPLQSSLSLPDDLDATAASVVRIAGLLEGHLLDIGGCENMEFSDFLATNGVRCACLIACSQQEFAKMKSVIEADSEAIPFRSTPVNSRGRFPPVIGRTSPTPKDLRLWRLQVRQRYEEMCDESAVPPPVNVADPLLYLPEGGRFEKYSKKGQVDNRQVRGKREVDPVRMVQAINVAQHLRQPALFQTVLEGCIDYLDEEEHVPEIRHDYGIDPSRNNMDRALARGDVVAMLLQRRLFRHWQQENLIKSINDYSDKPPVVGAELQGMIVDVNFKREWEGMIRYRMVLPGSTLAYGFASSASKSVALLHALWLVGGPTAEDVRYLCNKIISLTTDMGVEMHLLEAPDVVDAFLAQLNDTPLDRLRPLVKRGVRMWPRALRLAGWSHTMGGIMKLGAEAFDEWPVYLREERALCKFFKNVTYRKHLVRELGPTCPHLKHDLKGFTAGFAKWRYETVVEVLRQLLRHRDLCQNKMKASMFSNAQDQEEMKGVFKACQNREFWHWAAVVHPQIFERIEKLRQWGMVCDHPECEELRRASNYRKHIQCPRTKISLTKIRKMNDTIFNVSDCSSVSRLIVERC